MYENLTCLIDALETDTYGEMVVDTKSKGTLDDPIHLPYIKYTDAVSELWKAIYGFSDMHPEFELTNYQDILAKHGLAWAASDLKDADVTSADGQLIMAILIGITRAERFSEGTLLEFCKNGVILKCLKRLKEIDNE